MKKYNRPHFYGAEIFSAFVFLCSLSAAFMYTLCRDEVFATTCIMTAVSFGIYMLFYVLRNKRAFALLAFIACLLVSITLFSAFMQISPISAVDFLFKASEVYDGFMAAAFISIFSFIIGFSTAYFNVYLPRPAFLLLPAFIPLLLAAKTAGGLPAGYVIFTAVGYALVVLGVSRPEYPSEISYTDDKKSRFERLGALGIFGAVIALAIFAVPRSTETPLGEYLDTVFKRESAIYGAGNLSNFTNASGVNHGANEPSDNILFYVNADYPVLLSRWNFDNYNDNGSWTAHSDYTTGWSGWRNYKENLDADYLSTRLYNAAQDGLLSDYAQLLSELPHSKDEHSSKVMQIYVVDGSNTRVVIHPNMTVDASIRRYDGDIYRTLMDEMFTESNFGSDAVYFLKYYDNTPNSELIELFENVDMEELLSEAAFEGVITETEKNAFLNERSRAEEYHEKTLEERPISSEIIQLANEITEGLTSDYEKAIAIERWFGEAGFVYDLDFVPDETSAEYFLFKSRRGICTDFATASALLLRAADIPTRYTEGFLIKEENKNEYGAYAVKSANAHAFAMCYIEGYGWLEIDGTKYAVNAEDIEENNLLPLVLLITAILLGVCAFIFRRQLSEAIFAVSVKFGSDKRNIRAIYLRTRKLACKIADKEPKSATSAEVAKIISNSLNLEKQAQEIASCADELFYNNTISPHADRLYSDYREIVRMKKKMRK